MSFSRSKNKILIFKTIDGAFGEGIFSAKWQNGEIYDFSDQKTTIDEIFDYCFKSGRDYLIQEFLYPHEKFKILMPTLALGTLRIVTLKLEQKDTIKIPFAAIRLPVEGSITDNFRHGEPGNFVCGINPNNGKIISGGGRANPYSLSSLLTR